MCSSIRRCHFDTCIPIKRDSTSFCVFLSVANSCLKGHLLPCHSETCRGSFLKGHLVEKMTVPPDSSWRSHFQHSCGHWLTIRSLLSVSLSVSRAGRGPQYMPPCDIYHWLFTVFRFWDRHQLYVCRSYVLLYNLRIIQLCDMKRQASANISCLFAFKVNPVPFLSSSFPESKMNCSRRYRWLLNVCWM